MPSVEAGQTTLASPSILPYPAYPCESMLMSIGEATSPEQRPHLATNLADEPEQYHAHGRPPSPTIPLCLSTLAIHPCAFINTDRILDSCEIFPGEDYRFAVRVVQLSINAIDINLSSNPTVGRCHQKENKSRYIKPQSKDDDDSRSVVQPFKVQRYLLPAQADSIRPSPLYHPQQHAPVNRRSDLRHAEAVGVRQPSHVITRDIPAM